MQKESYFVLQTFVGDIAPVGEIALFSNVNGSGEVTTLQSTFDLRTGIRARVSGLPTSARELLAKCALLSGLPYHAESRRAQRFPSASKSRIPHSRNKVRIP